MTDPAPDLPTAPDRAVRCDGFTPARQRRFLESLAANGLVRTACAAAGISHETVYTLRHRHDGAAFRLGWDAALLLARVALSDRLMERAIDGQEEVITHDPATHTRTRHRHDTRLALALLARLDRFADDAAPAHGDVRMVAGDWEAFLDLVAAGHNGSGVALFLAARRIDPAGEPCSGPCQLCGAAPPPPPDTDDAAQGEDADDPDAALFDHYTVWHDDESGTLRTNFPPPPGFDGEEYGEFEDAYYARTLTDEEDAIERAARAAEQAAEYARLERLRQRWLDGARACAAEWGAPVPADAG